jgi:hypothetical protein
MVKAGMYEIRIVGYVMKKALNKVDLKSGGSQSPSKMLGNPSPPSMYQSWTSSPLNRLKHYGPQVVS